MLHFIFLYQSNNNQPLKTNVIWGNKSLQACTSHSHVLCEKHKFRISVGFEWGLRWASSLAVTVLTFIIFNKMQLTASW